MRRLPDFKTRVQFSFGEAPSDISDESVILYNKVAELFRSKMKLGSLKYWLLELAYDAAEKELALERGVESGLSVEAVRSDEALPRREKKAERSTGEIDKPSASEVALSDPQEVQQVEVAAAPQAHAQALAKAPQVQERVGEDGLVENWIEDGEEVDMSIYEPKTLSGNMTAKKRVEMPQSMRNLVLKT